MTFHNKWQKTQSQIDVHFTAWADAIQRKEFYHWRLYTLARKASEQLSELHMLQHSGMSIRPENQSVFEDQLAEKHRMTRELLENLNEKIQKTIGLNQAADDLPWRADSAPEKPENEAAEQSF